MKYERRRAHEYNRMDTFGPGTNAVLRVLAGVTALLTIAVTVAIFVAAVAIALGY